MGFFDSSGPSISVAVDVLFPANVVSGAGVHVDKTNSIWSVGLDYVDLTENGSISTPSSYYVAVWDAALTRYEKVRLDNLNLPTLVDFRTPIGDANYLVTVNDRYIGLTAQLTAIRTITLPAASSVPPGRQVTLQDEAGGVSPAFYHFLTPTGADTISGFTSWTQKTRRGGVVLRSNGLNAWNIIQTTGRSEVLDANYTVTLGDQLVAYKTLSAARTIALPAVAAFPVGQQLAIVDESGNCSATNTLTANRAGADTISGATSVVIAIQNGYLALEGDGVSRWTIVDNNTITGGQITAITSINGGPLAGFRNKVINGDFRNDQTLSGAAYTLTTTMTFGGADRWYFGQNSASANAFTAQRFLTGGPPGSPSFLRFQRTPGNTYAGVPANMGTIIEMANMARLAGQTVTLSYLARCGANYSPASSAFNYQVFTGTTADQGLAALGTWAGLAVPISSADILTTSWQKFFHPGLLASTALELAIQFGMTPTGTAGAADYFDITDVQFEPGPVATPFEFRANELQLCEKYNYQRNSNSGVDVIGTGQATAAGTVAGKMFDLPVTMFKAPTMSVSNGAHFSCFQANGATVAFTGAAFTADQHNVWSNNGLTGASGLTAGNASMVYMNTTSAWIRALAELT